MPLPHEVFVQLRDRCSQLVADEVAGGAQTSESQDEMRTRCIRRVVGDYSSSEHALSPEEEHALGTELFAALYGLGPLQPFLDDPNVENIDVVGAAKTFIRFGDGRKLLYEDLFPNDDEVVRVIGTAVASHGLTERRFDRAHPIVKVRLRDGSRMCAVQGVSPHPSVSIRRHRLGDMPLGDLVLHGMLDADLAEFLVACVQAKKNIVVAGPMNGGKTTLLRALCAEIPPAERIITVEQTLELGLDAQEARHPDCVAMEAREAKAEGQGEMTMAELVKSTLHMNADRVIVGEVLGSEVVPMLKAMSQGRSGSMCTIHAENSEVAFQRLTMYALEDQQLPVEAVERLICSTIHLVVQIDAVPIIEGGEHLGMRRVVSSIREVEGYIDGRRMTSELWRPDPESFRAVQTSVPPTKDLRTSLERVGYEFIATEPAWT